MQVVSLRCVDANNNLPGNAKFVIMRKMKKEILIRKREAGQR